LAIGLSICSLIYTLLQFAIVRTIGNSPTEHPVVDTVSVWMGHGAGLFVAAAVMISTYGWISGAFLNAPRLAVSLAHHGDCPAFLGRLHPRFHTPSAGILLYAVAVAALAVTGTFLWVIAVTAGAVVVFYLVGCAALIRLRHLQPKVSAFRAPFGPAFAICGIVISAVLMTELEWRQLGLMCFTALVAAANWLWARRNTTAVAPVPSGMGASDKD
jgi:basic amino acid/polyamine antiporter, APA family